MNPIEQIWKEIRKRGFQNEVFDSLEAVIDRLCFTIKNLRAAIIKKKKHHGQKMDSIYIFRREIVSIIPRYRKVVVPSTHTTENHDFISSDQGQIIYQISCSSRMDKQRQSLTFLSVTSA